MKNIKDNKMTKKVMMMSALMGALVLGGALGVSGSLVQADEADASFNRRGTGGSHQYLTEEQGNVLEEIRELRQEGNFEEAQALAEENDVGLGFRGNKGGMNAGRFSSVEERDEFREEHREDVENAIESQDFEAFEEAMSETHFADQITEEHFEKVMEAHALKEAGDYEEAREIMNELGRGGPRGGRM